MAHDLGVDKTLWPVFDERIPAPVTSSDGKAGLTVLTDPQLTETVFFKFVLPQIAELLHCGYSVPLLLISKSPYLISMQPSSSSSQFHHFDRSLCH